MPAAGDEPASDAVLRRAGLEVRFVAATRTFRISDEQLGPVLDRGVAVTRSVRSDDKRLVPQATVDADQGKLVVRFGQKLLITARITDAETVELVASGSFAGPVQFSARAAAGPGAMPAILRHEQASDHGVLIMRLGPAAVPGSRSLLDPATDLALTASAARSVRWQPSGDWRLYTSAAAGQTLLSLRLWPHYYRDTLGIGFYAPMVKRSFWKTAPVLAMTWYGIEGWRGQPAQRKEWLYPQINWVAEHLLPYAERMVFQLDDNYPYQDDKYMRQISDYIRSKGLIPGIWFTPYGVAPSSLHKEHPEWFLHASSGRPLEAFAGVNWHDVTQHSSYVLNVNSVEAVDRWFGMFWRKVSQTWNYDFFKIDGQPAVAQRYRASRDGGGVAGYRRGLRIGRRLVGPDKFINSCYGIALDAAGLVNGARTGPDTGMWPHANEFLIRWNFLNNVVWWCDPDAPANQYRAPVTRVRLNAQARVLTGQQFLTDDVWTKMPEANRWVWQRSFPTLDIQPVNLYRIDDWKPYDLFDLRIAKPWGTCDVVGLFNYEGRPVVKKLDLGRLPLEHGDYHVLEFWSQTYLGRYARGETLLRRLKPHEGQLFAVVRARPGKPILLSSNRHVSQGGLDLDAAEWQPGAPMRLVGRSSHLVAGDPYELVLETGPWQIVEAAASIGPAQVRQEGGIAWVRITPRHSGTTDWTITFERLAGPAMRVAPRMCEVQPATKVRLEVVRRTEKGFQWRAQPSDPRIVLSSSKGELGGTADRSLIELSVDASGLQPGSTWTGHVDFTGAGQTQRVAVTLHVPTPPNLALAARASASSRWENRLAYHPMRVNDGLADTRWNSAQGDENGCWVALRWAEPQTFNRVVIDECTDFGLRIKRWRLAAGDKQLKVIAQGTQVGRKLVIQLDKPVTARRLQLVIEKAATTPTLWELEVYDWPGGGD